MPVRFFSLAYGLAWVAWLPLLLSQRGLGLAAWDGSMTWMLPGLFAPTLAAIVMSRKASRWRLGQLVGTWRRAWLGVLLGFTLIAAAVIVVPALVFAISPWPALHWRALAYLPALALSWTSLRGGPLGEEAGWRMFALPRLQVTFGPTTASVVLGLLWAGWHAPLFLVRGFSSSPFGMFVIMMIALSVILTFVLNLTGANLFVAILTHSAFNAASRVLNPLLDGATTRDGLSGEMVIAASMVTVAVGLVLVTRGRLGYQRTSV
jgi:membrane protease YdiL (CAAX protease family)